MKKGIAITGLVLAVMGIFSCQQPEKQEEIKRPNIIIVMADDMGYSDLGFMGAKIQTPNIDRLAQNGLFFNQFYNTSRCCPSRAALLTSLYQHQAGVGDMTRDMGVPTYQGYLNDRCVTLAEVLKEAGYTTMMVGKWHLGSERPLWPTKRGFEKFYGIPEGGGVYFYPFVKKRNVVLNDSILLPDSTYYTTYAFNEYAARFIEEAAGEEQPFFLYVPHIAPHFPIQAPREEYEPYLGKFREGFQALRQQRFEAMKERGIIRQDMALSLPDSLVLDWDSLSEAEKDTFDLKMAIYAAQMEIMDRGMGQIVEKLKEKGELDNTIIFFLSDNGGTHEELANSNRYRDIDGPLGSRDSYRSYGRSWANVSNTPFRMYKHWVHEGGISSPLIVHYPELIKESRIDTHVTHIMDIMPTCLELAGAEYPATYEGREIIPAEGISFLPLLKGQGWPGHDYLFWEHEGNRAVRHGPWKLVSAYPENQWALYHIPTDRAEQQDLSEKYPERVKEMKKQYEQWAKRSGVVPRSELLSRK